MLIGLDIQQYALYAWISDNNNIIDKMRKLLLLFYFILLRVILILTAIGLLQRYLHVDYDVAKILILCGLAHWIP